MKFSSENKSTESSIIEERLVDLKNVFETNIPLMQELKGQISNAFNSQDNLSIIQHDILNTNLLTGFKRRQENRPLSPCHPMLILHLPCSSIMFKCTNCEINFLCALV